MRVLLTQKTPNDGANLQVEMEAVIAIEETTDGTRLHMNTGTVFTVYETIDVIDQYCNG